MRATGVLVRFLSLLDVALILLGVLMLALMYTQVRTPTEQGQSSASGPAELAEVDFVYLYAGWKGEESGKCYLLGPNGEVGQEVRTDSPSDIRRILDSRPTDNSKTTPVVMLLFGEDGWYAAWDADRMNALEEAWNLSVVPVYNVKLPR